MQPNLICSNQIHFSSFLIILWKEEDVSCLVTHGTSRAGGTGAAQACYSESVSDCDQVACRHALQCVDEAAT